MSWYFEFFGLTPLAPPTGLYDTTTGVGAGTARTEWLEIGAAGGAYDALGAAGATPGLRALHLRGDLLADTPAALQAAYDSLRARWGQSDALYARMGDGSVRWTQARLARMSEERPPDGALWQAVDLLFEQSCPLWYSHHHGAILYSDTGVYADTGYYSDQNDSVPFGAGGSQLVDFPMSGNAPIDNVVLSFYPSGAGITGPLGLSLGDADWSVAGTWAINPLTIDTGGWSVIESSAGGPIDRYSAFTLAGDHHLDGWLRLLPGENYGTLTFTPGSAGSLIPDYWEGWQ